MKLSPSTCYSYSGDQMVISLVDLLSSECRLMNRVGFESFMNFELLGLIQGSLILHFVQYYMLIFNSSKFLRSRYLNKAMMDATRVE